MKKQKLLLIILLSGLLLLFFSISDRAGIWTKDSSNNDANYLLGVHYFGNAWPLNFWNSSLQTVDRDFERIKKDGFNSVIFVVPWGEFQPGIDPIKYNRNAFDRLQFLIHKAESHGLKVILRVSYTWDYAHDVQMANNERFLALFTDEQIHKAWKEYISELYKYVEDSPNFVFAFLSWEDFWGIVNKADSLNDMSERLAFAQEIGFQEYLRNNYTLKDVSAIYGYQITDWGMVPIPNRFHPSYSLFLKYYDKMLIDRIFKPAQKIIPKLSMEIRVDGDPVYNGREIDWYYHTGMYDLPNAEYLTLYYSPAMGSRNVGDEQSSDTLLQLYQNILEKINSFSGKKKLFIDQFNFFDNTPGFENNTRIKLSELNKFIVGSAKLINNTNGYAVWTYKDYEANLIYNPGFDLDSEGWQFKGSTVITKVYMNNKVAFLKKGGDLIRQAIPKNRNHYYNSDKRANLSFWAQADGMSGKILIKIGQNYEVVKNIDKEGKVYTIELPIPMKELNSYNLEIRSINENILIDNIKLFSHIQRGKIYDTDWQPDSALPAIQKLNNIITGTGHSSFDANGNWKEFEDSRDILIGSYEIEGKDGEKYVWIPNSVSLKLRLLENDEEINIKGYIPFSLHKKENKNLREVKVTVFINDKVYKVYPFKKDKVFNININHREIQKFVSDAPHINLGIKVNNEFIPAQIGEGSDERKLSAIVYYIRIN